MGYWKSCRRLLARSSQVMLQDKVIWVNMIVYPFLEKSWMTLASPSVALDIQRTGQPPK